MTDIVRDILAFDDSAQANDFSAVYCIMVCSLRGNDVGLGDLYIHVPPSLLADFHESTGGRFQACYGVRN
jgi:hypothetical protein